MDLVRKRQKLILGIDIRQKYKQGRVILCKSFAHFFFSFLTVHIQENLEDELVKEALEKVSRMVFLFFGKKRLGNVKECF